jgi:hypothetical protein
VRKARHQVSIIISNYNNWKSMLENSIPVTPITMFPSQLLELAANKAWNNFGIYDSTDFAIKSGDFDRRCSCRRCLAGCL